MFVPEMMFKLYCHAKLEPERTLNSGLIYERILMKMGKIYFSWRQNAN